MTKDRERRNTGAEQNIAVSGKDGTVLQIVMSTLVSFNSRLYHIRVDHAIQSSKIRQFHKF